MANTCDYGKVIFNEVVMFADYVRALDRQCLRVRGTYVAGAILKPGRLLVLLNGDVVNGPPSKGPVIGVGLARPLIDAYDPGEIQLALRGGTVIVDGDIGEDLGPVYVDASGAFVLSGANGAELVPGLTARTDNEVEVNL